MAGRGISGATIFRRVRRSDVGIRIEGDKGTKFAGIPTRGSGGLWRSLWIELNGRLRIIRVRHHESTLGHA